MMMPSRAALKRARLRQLLGFLFYKTTTFSSAVPIFVKKLFLALRLTAVRIR